MVPWLTLRGLHTDRLEGFSAGHWLTFRGLPAECLGDRSHEAASFPFRRDDTSGVLDLRRPPDGLSLAARRDSNPMDGLLGGTSSDTGRVSGNRNNTASGGMAGDLFGMVLGAPRTPPMAWTPGPGGLQGPRRSSGCGFAGTRPVHFLRGISGVGTWISHPLDKEVTNGLGRFKHQQCLGKSWTLKTAKNTKVN